MNSLTQIHDKDAEQLKALGYVSKLERSINFWQNFARGFEACADAATETSHPSAAMICSWKPAGTFKLGWWGWPVNLAALTYGVGAIINMMWPRVPGVPWYVNYAILATTVIPVAAGLLCLIAGKPHLNPGNVAAPRLAREAAQA